MNIARPLQRLRNAWKDHLTALAYHRHKLRVLALRGWHSLRARGPRATWQAIRRYLQPREVAPPAAPRQGAVLAFVTPAHPLASIVIPVHGKLPYTLACLHSVAAQDDAPPFEVIVVDDASPDGSATMLDAIPGLRVIRNATNLGFVGSCNAGAAAARGEFLVFLNNDTTVSPGWLGALLHTFVAHPDTGLAGAALVYPDGRLQECGSLVFADGSGWNLGRFEDPDWPPYRHVREVDYCSGAAIAIRRSDFDALGGFDPRYAPAYYEDTDLAMRVRAAGKAVRVQPASRVIHHEGISAGGDLAAGMKRFQVRNQSVFVARWADVLARDHAPPGTDIPRAVHWRARRRVLLIDETTPMPDRDSGSVRLMGLMDLLRGEGCALTFFNAHGKDDGRYTEALRQRGVEVWTRPALGAVPTWLKRHGRQFDLVIVSRHTVLSPLLPLLRRHAPQARVIFDTVDLHFLREQREAEQRGDTRLAAHARRTREAELALVRQCDRTWVVSPVEQALLARDVPGARVDVVSNILPVRGPGPGFARRDGLLFVGGYRHPPNVDAVRWFADAVLPRIHARRPDIALHLVGSDVPPAVAALGDRPGITVHGHVADLQPLLDRARVSIAPLRFGAGVKGKVNQALAHGLPVVATPCAVEGMGLTDGVDVRVADDAEAFAAAVLQLHEDAALWQRLSSAGLRHAEAVFSPAPARAVLRDILATC